MPTHIRMPGSRALTTLHCHTGTCSYVPLSIKGRNTNILICRDGDSKCDQNCWYIFLSWVTSVSCSQLYWYQSYPSEWLSDSYNALFLSRVKRQKVVCTDTQLCRHYCTWYYLKYTYVTIRGKVRSFCRAKCTKLWEEKKQIIFNHLLMF